MIYSEATRMGSGGHKNPRTYHQFYRPKNVGANSQDAYFGDDSGMRTIVSDYFHSLTLRRNPDLWQTLPAERQHELEERPEWAALERELEALSLVPQDSVVKNRRRELNKQKRKLIDCELAKCRKSQPNKLLSQAERREIESTGYHRTLFQRIRPFMPERDRLAKTLLDVAPLRSDKGRAALRDMIALLQQDTEILSRPELEFDKCCCRESEKQKIARFVTCSLIFTFLRLQL
jgi:hypothetical protein